eukprot:jgi/Ulvmu1/953/UM102_0036.1
MSADSMPGAEHQNGHRLYSCRVKGQVQLYDVDIPDCISKRTIVECHEDRDNQRWKVVVERGELGQCTLMSGNDEWINSPVAPQVGAKWTDKSRNMLRVVVDWSPDDHLNSCPSRDAAEIHCESNSSPSSGSRTAVSTLGDVPEAGVPLQDSQRPNQLARARRSSPDNVPEGTENAHRDPRHQRPNKPDHQKSTMLTKASSRACQASSDCQADQLTQDLREQETDDFVHSKKTSHADTCKQQKARSAACPAAQAEGCQRQSQVDYVASHPKPASRELSENFVKYTGWLGAHHICLRHDDMQGRFAVRSVRTERGTCVLKELPLMHWLLPDNTGLCAFCFTPLGKEGEVHTPPSAAAWERYCCAAHAAADVQVASIMADRSRSPAVPPRSARVLRYCAALQTLDNPLLLAKRFQGTRPGAAPEAAVVAAAAAAALYDELQAWQPPDVRQFPAHIAEQVRKARDVPGLMLEMQTFSEQQVSRSSPAAVRDRICHAGAIVTNNSFNIYNGSLTRTVGHGLYAAAAFINHSCDPNCAISFHGSQLQIHAVRPIPAGEALSISYVDLLSPPFARQTTLLQTYNFLCSCPRCVAPASPGVGHACLWTVRCQSASGSGEWRLERYDSAVQEHLAWAAGEASAQRSGAAGAADAGPAGQEWERCAAVHDASHAVHHATQVLNGPPLQPGVLGALKLQLKAAVGTLWRCSHPAHWVAISAHFALADVAEREEDWPEVEATATALLGALRPVLRHHHIVHACTLRRRGKARMKQANVGRRRARQAGQPPVAVGATKCINSEEMAVWAAEGRSTWTGLLGMAVQDLEAARDVFVVCNGRQHETVATCERWLSVCDCMAQGL